MMQHLTTDRIIDYLHGALPPQEDAAVYTHLEACAQCRAEYDAEAALGELLRARAALEERELPPMLKAQIWSRVRAAQPSPLSRLAAWWRPAIALPVAAAIALAAYFGTTYIGPRGGAPSIEAAYYLQDHAALNSTVPFSDRSSLNPIDLENEASAATRQTAVTVPAAYVASAGK